MFLNFIKYFIYKLRNIYKIIFIKKFNNFLLYMYNKYNDKYQNIFFDICYYNFIDLINNSNKKLSSSLYNLYINHINYVNKYLYISCMYICSFLFIFNLLILFFIFINIFIVYICLWIILYTIYIFINIFIDCRYYINKIKNFFYEYFDNIK